MTRILTAQVIVTGEYDATQSIADANALAMPAGHEYCNENTMRQFIADAAKGKFAEAWSDIILDDFHQKQRVGGYRKSHLMAILPPWRRALTAKQADRIWQAISDFGTDRGDFLTGLHQVGTPYQIKLTDDYVEAA